MTTFDGAEPERKASSLFRHLPVLRKGIGLVLLAVLAFAFLIPILWMTVMSFQEGGKMFDLRTEWIPAVWHFENYPNALSRAPFVQYFINSGIVSVTVMAGNVVFCTLAGYGLAKFHFRGSGLVLLLILSTLMPTPRTRASCCRSSYRNVCRRFRYWRSSRFATAGINFSGR